MTGYMNNTTFHCCLFSFLGLSTPTYIRGKYVVDNNVSILNPTLIFFSMENGTNRMMMSMIPTVMEVTFLKLHATFVGIRNEYTNT